MRGFTRQTWRQQGVSMLVALVTLTILLLASVALVRSIDTGTLIVGNLAFKQDATEVSAIAAEQAMAWLEANVDGTTLDEDLPTAGYYASSLDKLDPTAAHTSAAHPMALIDWKLDGCADTPAGNYTNCDTLPFTGSPIHGNQVQWVITRLCDSVGPPSAANLCARPVAVDTASAGDRGSLQAGGRISASVAGPYFRVIVKATGPRQTVSYTETMLHF